MRHIDKEMSKELFEPVEKELQEHSSPLKNSLLFRSTPSDLRTPALHTVNICMV
jgi:hypothetical protein